LNTEIRDHEPVAQTWVLDLLVQHKLQKRYILAAVFVLELFDWFTGFELSFNSFYLIPIFFACLGYGWRFAAQIMCFVMLYDVIEGVMSGHRFSQNWIFYFDVFGQLLSFTAFIFIVDLLRSSVLTLVRMADLDALTGLPNRRALDKTLTLELSRCKRSGEALGIMFIDCDDFKTVNDKEGHAAGDLVLKHVAAALRSQVREIDTVCRFGGDEFVLILPGANADSALQVAQKLRLALLLVMEREHWPITFSIGVYALAAKAKESVDARAFLARADLAMYAAKKNGKDRVVAI
jgi:diguanylate cyclase (GGDEF)-like protein